MSIDTKINNLKKEIEALELEKQAEALRVEIAKLKKTKIIEEEIITRKIYRDEYIQSPHYWPTHPNIWPTINCGGASGVMELTMGSNATTQTGIK